MSASAPAAMTEEQTRRALDAEIRDRCFPWDESRCGRCGWPLVESIDDGCIPGNCAMRGFRPEEKPRADQPARYSESHDAVAKVEEEIARRGLGAEYARRLAMTVIGVWSIPMEYDEMFALLRATPEMRCRAALSCLPAAPTNQKDGEP